MSAFHPLPTFGLGLVSRRLRSRRSRAIVIARERGRGVRYLVAAFGVAFLWERPSIAQQVQVVNPGIYTADTMSIQSMNSGVGHARVTNTRLVLGTTTIPAQNGVRFGFQYRITGAPNDTVIELRKVVRYPAPGARPPTSKEPTPSVDYATFCYVGTLCWTGYRIDHDWEMLPGTWAMELWNGGRKVAEQSFTVIPASGAAGPITGSDSVLPTITPTAPGPSTAAPMAGSGPVLPTITATAPVPSMKTDWWSDYYDTPTQGVAPGEASLVVAEITVNKYGGFAGCVGHVYVGNPQMGPYVCSRLEKRAVFDPARGPDGRKVIGIYRKLIVVANFKSKKQFRAPNFGIHIPSFGQGISDNPFEIQFYIDAHGQLSDCSLIESVGINLERHKQVVDPATVERACTEAPAQVKPVPPIDKNGNPIPTVQNALVIIDRPIDPQNQ